MHATTFGSSLKVLLGLGHTPSAERVDQGAILSELQAAYERLTSRLDDPSLSRSELIDLSSDLEPVARRLLQMRAGIKAAGRTHAVHLTDAALQDIYTALYYIRPWQPYVWPEALKARLWQVQHSLTQALVALRWARIQAGAPAA